MYTTALVNPDITANWGALWDVPPIAVSQPPAYVIQRSHRGKPKNNPRRDRSKYDPHVGMKQMRKGRRPLT